MCSYWRARLVPAFTPRGGMDSPPRHDDVVHAWSTRRTDRSCLDLFDHLRAERFQVIRLAARYEPVIDVHLLVDPVRARVAKVGLERRPRGQRPIAHHVCLDQRPRPMADYADGLV